jgi:hypothetical protein
MENKLISAQQAAQRLGMSAEKVVKLIESGDLIAEDHSLPGAERKTYKIETSEIDRWRESRRIRPKTSETDAPRVLALGETVYRYCRR